MENKLKHYRKRAGFTLQNLADRCYMSKSYIWEIEAQKTPNISLKIAHKISVILNRDIFSIFPMDCNYTEQTIKRRKIIR